MVYEYLNLPPEAKQAPVTEEEEVTEDAEDIETVEVYSTTDSSKDIQIGADHAAEDEEDDVPQAKDVEKLSDSVYYRMYLDEVRGRGEAERSKNARAVSADFAGRSGCCQRNRRRMVDADHSHGGYV